MNRLMKQYSDEFDFDEDGMYALFDDALPPDEDQEVFDVIYSRIKQNLTRLMKRYLRRKGNNVGRGIKKGNESD